MNDGVYNMGLDINFRIIYRTFLVPLLLYELRAVFCLYVVSWFLLLAFGLLNPKWNLGLSWRLERFRILSQCLEDVKRVQGVFLSQGWIEQTFEKLSYSWMQATIIWEDSGEAKGQWRFY